MARPQRIPLDQNRRAIYFVSSVDGATFVPPKVDPTTGALQITNVGNSVTLTTFFNSSVTATPTAVKTSSGKLHKFYIYNTTASVVFLQIFDLATGSVTLGTTPPKQSYAIPASGIFEDFFQYSDLFSTAITIAITTTVNGAVAPATGAVVNLGYI